MMPTVRPDGSTPPAPTDTSAFHIVPWLTSTERITLTLNAEQGDVGDYPTVFGVGGTFGGFAFKEVKRAS